MNELKESCTKSNVVSIGARLKQLCKQGVVFGLTSSLQSALTFILLPLYTKYFSLDQFGGYNIILIIAGVCQTIFYFGASSSLGRFYYEYKDRGKGKEIVSAALWLSFMGGFVQIILSLFFGRWICIHYLNNENLTTSFIICMFANAFTYPVTTMTLLLRYKKQSVFYMVVTVLGFLLNFTVTILLLIYSNCGVSSPFIGLFCCNLVILITLMFHNKDDLTVSVPSWLYRLVWIFGIQFMLSSFLTYLYQCVDKLVIKEALSISDVGIYSLGYRIANIYQILIYLPFALVWAPLRMEYKDNKDNPHFIKKIISYYTIISISFIILCIVWGVDVLLYLFPKQEYSLAIKIYPFIMIGFLFYGYTTIFDYGVYIKNKLFYLSIVPIACVVINVGLNLWLLPQIGIMGATYVFMVTYFIGAFSLLYFSNKYYPIAMEWFRVLISFFLFFIVYTVYIHFNFTFTHNFIFKIFTSFVYLVIAWKTLINKEERHKIVKLKI